MPMVYMKYVKGNCETVVAEFIFDTISKLNSISMTPIT